MDCNGESHSVSCFYAELRSILGSENRMESIREPSGIIWSSVFSLHIWGHGRGWSAKMTVSGAVELDLGLHSYSAAFLCISVSQRVKIKDSDVQC